MILPLFTSTVMIDPPSVGEAAKGLWLGMSLAFGLIWIVIKIIPWWLWLILIVVSLLRFFYFPRRRYFSREDSRGSSKTYIDENGYRRFLDSDKLVHRWVAEKKLGRKLDEEEVVHHKNEDKLDNRPSNLRIFTNQDEHDKKHGYYDEEDDYDYDDDDYEEDFN